MKESKRKMLVFLSYSDEDRNRIKPLVKKIQALGFEVWWDRKIPPGRTFAEVIESAMRSAFCAIVVWSRHSVNSRWVKEEAEEAVRRSIYLPVRIDSVEPPLGFRTHHTADLSDSQIVASSQVWKDLLRRIEMLSAGALDEIGVLSLDTAIETIRNHAARCGTLIADIEVAPQASTGTNSYRAYSKDGMGVIYCHADGSRRGTAFYIRKGIGIFYEHYLHGPQCVLGLPISNEELVDGKGYPTVFFEEGFIEWSPFTHIAQAIHRSDSTDQVVKEGSV